MNQLQTTVYLSKKGRKDFKKAISKLERERSKIIAGLHEQDKINNHEGRYEKFERLSQLDAVEAEIEEKREILRIAKPYPVMSSESMRKVTIGSEVELMSHSGERMIYTIVDTIEADPSHGRVSANSPLGQALLGRKPLETIEWPGIFGRNMKLMRIS